MTRPDTYPPQSLIEGAWEQYVTAQEIHSTKPWTLTELYGLFECAVQIGWDARATADAAKEKV